MKQEKLPDSSQGMSNILICDVIWENLPHVTQGSFTEINKIALKLLYFSIFFIIFDTT